MAIYRDAVASTTRLYLNGNIDIRHMVNSDTNEEWYEAVWEYRAVEKDPVVLTGKRHTKPTFPYLERMVREKARVVPRNPTVSVW